LTLDGGLITLFRIIYTSALADANGAVLPKIIEVATRNNQANDVSGLTLFADGHILQILEGEECQVRRTLSRISSDCRHSGAIIICEDPIPERSILGVSMGLGNTRFLGQKMPINVDYFKFSKSEIYKRVSDTAIQQVCIGFLESYC
jgi:hypothetical protein